MPGVMRLVLERLTNSKARLTGRQLGVTLHGVRGELRRNSGYKQ